MNTNSTELKNEIVNQIIIPTPALVVPDPASTPVPSPALDPEPAPFDSLTGTASEPVPEPSPSAPQLALAPKPAHEGRGRPSKVGRLPHAVREWIIESLLRNTPGHVIVAELEERGFPDFNDMNISTWRKGGFQRWLRDQENATD